MQKIVKYYIQGTSISSAHASFHEQSGRTNKAETLWLTSNHSGSVFSYKHRVSVVKATNGASMVLRLGKQKSIMEQ